MKVEEILSIVISIHFYCQHRFYWFNRLKWKNSACDRFSGILTSIKKAKTKATSCHLHLRLIFSSLQTRLTFLQTNDDGMQNGHKSIWRMAWYWSRLHFWWQFIEAMNIYVRAHASAIAAMFQVKTQAMLFRKLAVFVFFSCSFDFIG